VVCLISSLSDFEVAFNTMLICTGLRDVNIARVKITERYVLQCDEVFAVCDIGRAATDAGVEAVFELARRTGIHNISIICTKADASIS
jgi:hypothetical protein